MRVNRLGTAVLGMLLLAGLVAIPALAAGKSQTLTGQISDACAGRNIKCREIPPPVLGPAYNTAGSMLWW